MAEINFLGRAVTLTVKQENYIYLHKAMEQSAKKHVAAFAEEYDTYTSFTELASRIRLRMGYYFKAAVKDAIEFIHDCDYYGINDEEFIRRYTYSAEKIIDNACKGIEAQHYKIQEQKDMEKAYRDARKASRGRFIGGGFGTEAAVKGIATAGMLNMATGAGHSLINAFGNSRSEKNAQRQMANAFASPRLKTDLMEALRKAIVSLECSIENALLPIMEVRIAFDILPEENREYVDEIIAEIREKEVSNESLSAEESAQKLYKAWRMYPFHEEIYVEMFRIHGDEDESVTKLATMYGFDAEELKLYAIGKEIELILKEDGHSEISQCCMYELTYLKDCLELLCDSVDVEKDDYPEVAQVFECIEECMVAADIEERTVEGILFDSKEDAEAMEEDIESFDDFLYGRDIVDEDSYAGVKAELEEMEFTSNYFIEKLPERLERYRKLRDIRLFKQNVMELLNASKFYTEAVKNRISLEIPVNEELSKVVPAGDKILFYYNAKDVNRAGLVITDKSIIIYEYLMFNALGDYLVLDLEDLGTISLYKNSISLRNDGEGRNMKSESINAGMEGMQDEQLDEFEAVLCKILDIIEMINDNKPEILAKKFEPSYFPLFEQDELEALWDKCSNIILSSEAENKEKILNDYFVLGNTMQLRKDEMEICERLGVNREENPLLILAASRNNGMFERGILLYDTYVVHVEWCSQKNYSAHSIDYLKSMKISGMLDNIMLDFYGGTQIKEEISGNGLPFGAKKPINIALELFQGEITAKVKQREKKQKEEIENLRKELLEQLGNLDEMDITALRKAKEQVRGTYEAEIVQPVLIILDKKIQYVEDNVYREKIGALLENYLDKTEDELQEIIKELSGMPESVNREALDKVQKHKEGLIIKRKNAEVEALCENMKVFTDKTALLEIKTQLQQQYPALPLAQSKQKEIQELCDKIDIRELEQLCNALEQLSLEELNALQKKIEASYEQRLSQNYVNTILKLVDRREKELLERLAEGYENLDRDSLQDLLIEIKKAPVSANNRADYVQKVEQYLLELDIAYVQEKIGNLKQEHLEEFVDKYEVVVGENCIPGAKHILCSEIEGRIKSVLVREREQVISELTTFVRMEGKDNGTLLLNVPGTSFGSVAEKMRNRNFPDLTEFEEKLLCHDATLLGESRAGFIMASQYLYFVGKAGAKKIPLSKIDAFVVEKKLLTVTLYAKCSDFTRYELALKASGKMGEYVENVLNYTLNLLKKSRLSYDLPRFDALRKKMREVVTVAGDAVMEQSVAVASEGVVAQPVVSANNSSSGLVQGAFAEMSQNIKKQVVIEETAYPEIPENMANMKKDIILKYVGGADNAIRVIEVIEQYGGAYQEDTEDKVMSVEVMKKPEVIRRGMPLKEAMFLIRKLKEIGADAGFVDGE